MSSDIIQAQLDKVRHAESLLKDAEKKLAQAISSGSSASTIELFDMFTTNKAISLWSTLSSSNANSSMYEAEQAIRRLNEALRDLSETHIDYTADISSDIIDLGIDLFYSPQVDILSFFNFSRLNSSVNECRKVQQALSELANKLTRYESKLRKKLSKAS